MYIYINGQMVEKEKAMISPFDHGYLYGMGLFETFRVYEGHPFLLDNHLERLNRGLEMVHINHRFQRQETYRTLQKLLEANHLRNAYIRFNVSAGVGEIGLQVKPYDNPTVIIYSKPLPEAGGLVEKQARLLQLNRNTPEGMERLKSHHYMNNMLAKREIGESANLEGIFLTKEGFIAEGIVSNIFWKKGNVLYTPSLSTGILNGITRQFVITLAKRAGLTVEEGTFRVEQVLVAEELFVTNSIQEIVPISSFEGHSFPGKHGGFTQKLHRDYRHYCKSLWATNELERG